jgi:arylsulfatase A-like enzyme
MIQEKDCLTEKFAQEAVDFIDRNKDKPFLLYVPFNAPHEPFQVPIRYYERFKEVQDANKRAYYAMISALDDAVGAIVKKVRDAGLEEKTLFVFASDNGGATYTLATPEPLRPALSPPGGPHPGQGHQKVTKGSPAESIPLTSRGGPYIGA